MTNSRSIWHSRPVLIAILLAFLWGLWGLPAVAQEDDLPVIRFGTSEDIGINDAVRLLAVERLREQGYTVEMTAYAESVFAVEMMARDELDIATFSIRTLWGAAGTGIDVVTVMQDFGMDFVLVGTQDITSCDDWKGRRVVYNAPTSLTASIGTYYFQNICPGANPEILFIAGSSNRAAALLTGAIDATVVHLDSALRIIDEAPDEFTVLVNLREELPWLVGSGVHVRGGFAEEHPEVVQDVVNAFVTTSLSIEADPTVFIAEAANLLDEDPEEIGFVVENYSAAGLYDLAETFADDSAHSLAFFKEQGNIPADVDIDDLIDSSYFGLALMAYEAE